MDPMNSVDHIMRIIADSREQLRSELEKPSNPILVNEFWRRFAMSEERIILPKAKFDKHLKTKASPSPAISRPIGLRRGSTR
jgi:hypothetical protein